MISGQASFLQNRVMRDVAGVKTFPTFHLYVNGHKIDEVIGADVDALKRAVQAHRPKATA